VQEALQKALCVLLHDDIEITGCGRTDTGVHAKFYMAHFDSLHDNLDKNDAFVQRMNGIIPPDIAIKKILKVTSEAHARYDAINRTYEYRLTLEKDPFRQNYAYFLKGRPDVDKMKHASLLLLKYEDFKSFSKLHSDNKTTTCKIYKAEWIIDNMNLIFRITADRFLRSMVRTIVGTLLKVGLGKMNIKTFDEIIKSQDRSKAAALVPAHGLYLTDVVYPEKIFIGD
jgi:tRNA pseudouridine38-40 synthase